MQKCCNVSGIKNTWYHKNKGKKIGTIQNFYLTILKFQLKFKKEKLRLYWSKGNIIIKLKYHVPGDISSTSFFLVLTILAKKSWLIIKNVNVNDSRIGIIKILNKMNAKISLKNKKKYNGEMIADIFVKSENKLKRIICPKHLNSSAIDEFLIIFLVAAKAKGVSNFNNLSELNKKESPRLILRWSFLNDWN